MEQVGQAAAAKATEVGAVAGRDEAANIDLVEFFLKRSTFMRGRIQHNLISS